MNSFMWGRGDKGQLGLGDKRDRYEPTLLLDTNTVEKKEWIHIEGGGYHTVGLTKDGEVFTWGRNDSGQLGHGDDGQFGHGDAGERSVPTKVSGLDGLVITKVSCGYNHTAALTDKGEMLTWGFGYNGQLGHNTQEISQLIPKKVEALADEVIVEVACGAWHTCAVTSTGSIFTWGIGIVAGPIDNVVNPRLLQDLSSKGIVSMSAINYHMACVTKAGEVFTWGDGQYGRLGHGQERDQETPKRVEALVGVNAKTVSCGQYHTAVCTEDGHVYTCGCGEDGQLGHGDKENRFSPALVQALDGKHIIQVQCGYYHTMALTTTGYVFTWGYGEWGELGHGNFVRSSKPCLVEALREHNVVQISSGDHHCAVLIDPASPSIIRQSQQASFNNKLHSDVVLMVENEPLYTNVDVLTQKSDYFAAMFRSNMRESIERVVQVPNCSKASFLLVLEYLSLDGFTVNIYHAAELWGIADMYQMEGLKYACIGALERCLSQENVSEVLEDVEGLSCPCDELKSFCHEFLEDHDEEFMDEDEDERDTISLLCDDDIDEYELSDLAGETF